MSDPLNPLRAAVSAARAIQEDMNALGVGKPLTPPQPRCAGCGLPVEDDPHLIKEWTPIDVRETWHTTCFVREHDALFWPTVIPDDIMFILRRWRLMVERRAQKYLDTPSADFLGRMMMDEVAQFDAWLAAKKGGDHATD